MCAQHWESALNYITTDWREAAEGEKGRMEVSCKLFLEKITKKMRNESAVERAKQGSVEWTRAQGCVHSQRLQAKRWLSAAGSPQCGALESWLCSVPLSVCSSGTSRVT